MNPLTFFHQLSRPVRLLSIAALLAVLGLGALSAPIARAATTITVTSTSGGTGGPGCTLRDAITAANTDATTGGCASGTGGPFTIELAASTTYTLDVVDNTDPALGANGLPVVLVDVTILGNGSTIVRDTASGTPGFRIFQVDSSGTLRLNNVTISNGSSAGNPLGGGAYNAGVLMVSNSTFSSNRAANNGGAIFNSVAASVTITSSVFTGNSSSNGGGLYDFGTAMVANSTFVSNTASFGGAINNGSGSTAVINSTLSNNSASTTGGAIYLAGGAVTASNTIMANSTTGGNCGGTITDGSGNLRWPDTDFSCVGTFGDPRLGALVDNGGPTQTMALQSGSAALEHGTTSVCASPEINNLDQRGDPRPNPTGTSCDTGAFESSLRPPPLITISFIPSSVLTNQPSQLAFNLRNPNSTGGALTGIGFTNTLPSNLLVASAANLTNSCGGSATATSGSGAITLTGGTLTPNASCTINVNVSSAVPGQYVDTTGMISSTESGVGYPSNSVTLTVMTQIFMPLIQK